MQADELYEVVLDLRVPWKVDRVEVDKVAERVTVRVAHPNGVTWECPDCGKELVAYDHAPERRWRHLDTCQYETYLVGRVPRVACPECGVKQVRVSWAEPNSRFTMEFESHAIDVLQSCQTVKGAGAILRISWDQCFGIMERAVHRGQSRKEPQPIPRCGVDEKAFSKGQEYVTIICDIDQGTVEAIADHRDTESLRICFSQLTDNQLQSIEAIAMDMHAPYIKATRETLPLADTKIVHDRFHIMQHATAAVDKVRRREHKQLKADGDDRLARSKYIWLKSQENLTEKQQQRLDEIFSINLDTGKAWGYKEALRDLWHNATPSEAREFFDEWYRRVIHTRLTPMKKVARMIKERIDNVVSYCRHWITNAVAEGLNSKIMAIKRRVGGFRNRDNFKLAIYFYCGGLDLYPR